MLAIIGGAAILTAGAGLGIATYTAVVKKVKTVLSEQTGGPVTQDESVTGGREVKGGYNVTEITGVATKPTTASVRSPGEFDIIK